MFPTATFEFKALSLERNDLRLFSDLKGELTSGQALQITGQNGSGKSSLLRLFASFMRPCAGHVLFQNTCIFEHESYTQNLHYLGHRNALKANLTVYENLQYFCALNRHTCDVNVLTQVLHKFGLAHVIDGATHSLSAGQLRRLSLAKLELIPRVLWILDEPLTALDAKGQTLLHEMLASHLTHNGLAIIATHHDFLLDNLNKISLGVAHA